MLCAAYGQLVIDDFFDEVFFEDGLELLAGVLLGQLPPAEGPMERVIHRVHTVTRPLLAKAALLDPTLPLIKGLGDDLEVRVPEKESDYGAVHLAFLLLTLFRKVVRDVLL